MITILAGYLVIINIITLAVYGSDKKKAINHEWRVPEKILLLLAFVGGSVGALLGMKVFRHKTKHLKFIICNPLFFILQAALLGYLFVLK